MLKLVHMYLFNLRLKSAHKASQIVLQRSGALWRPMNAYTCTPKRPACPLPVSASAGLQGEHDRHVVAGWPDPREVGVQGGGAT
eukprot:27408-Eustigmatos_ZCMA.PRE.1